jgi:outer membrane protein insertion porin family
MFSIRTAAVLFLALWTVSLLAQPASVIREVTVRGNARVSKEAILAAMRTKAGQPYVQESLDADQRAIDDLGFFQSVRLTPTPLEGGAWQIFVDVAEFPEIKEFRVTGNTVVPTDQILQAITLRVGDVFNLNSLRPSRDAIRQLYARRGFYADVEDFSALTEAPGTVNLAILETKVGTVSVQGNTRTRDRVMRRLIKTKGGDPLSLEKWSQDLRRIYNTQWFTSVRSQEEQADLGTVNLAALVEEGPTGMFNIGLQIDPENSIAGLLKLSNSNWQGTGQGVGLSLVQSAGGGGLSVDLDYTNPFIDRRDTAMRVGLYSRVLYRFNSGLFQNQGNTDSDRYIERRTGGSLGFSRPVNDDLTVGLTLRAEDVKTENLTQNQTAANQIRQDGTLSGLTFAGTLNRRDTDIDPSRGSWIRAELEPGISTIRDNEISGQPSVGQAKGTSSFVKANVEFRYYWSDQPPRGRDLDAPRRVLALRARAGRVFGTVPFFEQYFAGGSDTLRGYEEMRFWGNTMVLTSLEYRYPIQRAFNAIAFVDYGGAWNGYGEVNGLAQSGRLRIGYGLGLSFRTPLGPIRLDLGFNDEGKSRTHFLIGTSF